MAQQDGRIATGNGTSIEIHIGNAPGSSGQNAAGPADAPIVGSKVVATPVNKTIGSIHLVTPA